MIANERYLDNTPEIPDSEHNSPEPGDRRPMPSEGRGHWFESSRVHHLFNNLVVGQFGRTENVRKTYILGDNCSALCERDSLRSEPLNDPAAR